jgi:NAD-dependent dihydropyrimidine dehydrogenase PreA subunit
MAKIHVDPEKCISCGDCVTACPAIFLREGERIRTVEEEHCTLCGHCLAFCPEDAITIQELAPREFPDLPADLKISPETLATFMRSRRSCRVFADKEVPRQALEKLIDLARYAPSGHNSQNFEFIVAQNRELVRTLAQRTAIFFGNLYKMLSAPGVSLPPWLQTHMRGFRLNW